MALLALVSCSKEAAKDNNEPTVSRYLTATIEQDQTKATLNGSLQTVWQSGEVIKVHVENNAESWSTDADCSLSSGEETTKGVFNAPSYPPSENRWKYVAFYPSVSGSATKTGVTFNLPKGYDNYFSGQFLLPLMADMTGDDHASVVEFKHVGGGVRIQVKDVPANAHTASMTVSGQKITGGFPAILASAAGTGKLEATTSTADDQTVNLNFATAANTRDFDFIFPVPTVETPTLTFRLWSDNDLELWSAKASSQPSVGRAELLDFPAARTVTPAKVATHVVNNNTFYLTGNNVGDESGDYDGTKFPFSNGSYSVTFDNNGYVNIKNGTHTYWTTGYLSKTYQYAEIATTISDTDHAAIVINNQGKDQGEWKTANIDLGDHAKGKDFFITIGNGGATISHTINEAPEDYTFASHSSTIRFWIINNTGVMGNDEMRIYLYNYSTNTGINSWPGASTASTTITPTRAVLTEESSVSGGDKLFIPKGDRSFTLSYNADGTLTLEYE